MKSLFFTQPFFQKNGKSVALFFLIAIVFWFIFLVIIPQLYMLDLSFRANIPPLERGGPKDFYTLEHYRHFVFGLLKTTGVANAPTVSINTIVHPETIPGFA